MDKTPPLRLLKKEMVTSVTIVTIDLSRLGSGERNAAKPQARRAERAGASESNFYTAAESNQRMFLKITLQIL